MDITIHPIGIIHTPFKNTYETPFQGSESPDSIGKIEIFTEFIDGLEGLEKVEHIEIIFNLHLQNEYRLKVIPRGSNIPRGVFSTRAPCHPNFLGITAVKLISIEGNILTVSGVDMLDNTPILDIKPYMTRFLPND